MTRACDRTVAQGRLRKAVEFYEAAETVGDLADDEAEVRDAVVTLLVHAGIAAADAISCMTLGRFALGSDNHDEAIDLLRTVRNPDGKDLAKRLSQLLGVKTKAAYTHRPVTAEERKRAERAAEKLVTAARAMT